MEQLISRISRGTRLDQIYIPKHRVGFPIGSYVLVKPLAAMVGQPARLNYYGVQSLEPIKVAVAQQIFASVDKSFPNDNIIIAGSFLERGFSFNDIDIIIISDEASAGKGIQQSLEEETGAVIHLTILPSEALYRGYGTDPLFQAMVSRCIAKNRLIFNQRQIFNYKLLDLHLLRSNPLIQNFDLLLGREKYSMVRNVIAIGLFLKQKKVTPEGIDKSIAEVFGKNSVAELKSNAAKKSSFVPLFSRYYSLVQKNIWDGIKNAKKQEKNN